LISHYFNLADVLVAQGDHEELARRASAMSSIPSERWIEPYNAACFLGRCMRLAATDPRLAEDDRRKAIESYEGKALDLLDESLRRGFKDLKMLREDPDLEPLRGREGFEKLMTRLDGGGPHQGSGQVQ